MDTLDNLKVQDRGMRRNRRALDLAIIMAWKQLEKPGDPPPFVQRAFDREQVQLLTGRNK